MLLSLLSGEQTCAEAEGAQRPSLTPGDSQAQASVADQVSLLGAAQPEGTGCAWRSVPTPAFTPGAARAQFTHQASHQIHLLRRLKGLDTQGMHAGGNSPDSLAKTCVQTAKAQARPEGLPGPAPPPRAPSVQKTATLSHPRLPWLPPHQRPGDPQPGRGKGRPSKED